MTLTIKAEKRDTLGKKLEASRLQGKLPVVIYGRKEASTSFFVDLSEFRRVFKEAGESTILKLDTTDGMKDVLIHDVQFHPVSGEPIHADFYAIEKGKKVEVHVPIVFTGEEVAPAVKELGGNLVKVMHELEVEALPEDLPHEIVVDVTSLINFESQIHVKDISLPKGVTALAEPDEVVVLVEEVKEEEVVSEPIDLASIEVEKKGKKEEEGEAEA